MNIAFEVVTRSILEKMFEDFKIQTKEIFFDELDEKFRDFSNEIERKHSLDLNKFTKLSEDWDT